MKEISALILAAGKGTRMKSSLPKVMHLVAGRPMLSYVIDAVSDAGIDKIAVLVGHRGDEVVRALGRPGLDFPIQERQLGTGHAVASAKDHFDGFTGAVLILCGDTPLIDADVIAGMVEFHRDRASALTVMTSLMDDPTGYGRIIRDGSDNVVRIVEQRDATEQEKAVREINTGIYLADAQLLFRLVTQLDANNSQGEYYLTDIIELARRENIQVQGHLLRDSWKVAGINTRIELAEASARVWDGIRKDLMLSGVTLLDPNTFFADYGVKVGPETVIHPNVTLTGRAEIGSGCVIEPCVMINDCVIGDNVNILLGSRLTSSIVQEGTSIGPMAHLRPEAVIGKNARIGNFVEVKKSLVGDGSKASHLTYLGDSTIGEGVNIGCGTITCNYDGKHKHRTVINDRCFVGSDVQFVAPVEIGEGSLIGAGSTITKDVPPHSLAVTRVKQKVYPLRKGQGPDSKHEDRGS